MPKQSSPTYNPPRSKPINIPRRNISTVDKTDSTHKMVESKPIDNKNSFLSNVTDGIAIGIGANVAERITSMIFGPRKVQIENTKIDCNLEEFKDYPQCKKE